MPDFPDNDALLEAESFIDRGQPERALECLRPWLARMPDDSRLLGIAGRAYNNAGRLQEAAVSFRRAVEADPGGVGAVSNLGHVLARMGDRSGAEAAWRQALALDPGNLRSLKGMAGLRAEAREYEEAAALLQRVVKTDPGDADNWLNLAEMLQFLDRQAEAVEALQTAAELVPTRSDIQSSLGRLFFSGGRVEAAERAYGRALECDSALPEAAAGRALCLEVMGQSAVGLELLAPWLSRADRPAVVDFAAGRLLAAEGREREALKHLERATGSEDPHWARNPMPWYARGAVLEKLERYDEAFDAWTEANRLKPARFDAADFSRRVDRIIRWHHVGRVSSWQPAQEKPLVKPVFIVGMPRSGTTLVEQILSCHPAVHAGGESLFFETLAARLWQANRHVSPDSEAEVSRLRDRWFHDVATDRIDTGLYTDKFPGNFMHLGLVRRILPEARVIWCRRNPEDTALSIYANDFNRSIVPWATRLENIAVAWDAHRRLMEHWTTTLRLPVVTVHYESLVEDLESEVRNLLSSLDLPWDASCLGFHRSGRLANTASFDQVRRPVYDTSIGRHRHFRSRLGSFGRVLER